MSISDKDQWTIKRTIENRANSLGKDPNYGNVRRPLLDLDPKQCPPDLLHMKKGVISKLLNQVK